MVTELCNGQVDLKAHSLNRAELHRALSAHPFRRRSLCDQRDTCYCNFISHLYVENTIYWFPNDDVTIYVIIWWWRKLENFFRHSKLHVSRSQWPAARSKLWSLSLSRTLGSWFRILLEAWMSVCVYFVFALRVGSGLATGWYPVQRVLLTMFRNKKLKKRPRSNKKL
jgi:hypothetical protein